VLKSGWVRVWREEGVGFLFFFVLFDEVDFFVADSEGDVVFSVGFSVVGFDAEAEGCVHGFDGFAFNFDFEHFLGALDDLVEDCVVFGDFGEFSSCGDFFDWGCFGDWAFFLVIF
jgi:hypothetical protein